MTHSIESVHFYVQLPTWHRLPQCTVPTKKDEELNLKPQNNESFAKTIYFLQSARTFSQKFLYDETDIDTDLFLVTNIAFNPEMNPLDYLIYKKRRILEIHKYFGSNPMTNQVRE